MPGVILPGKHTPQEIGSNRVLWLLTIHYGGEIIRLSTEEMDVYEAATGEWHRYHGVLDDLSFAERVEFLEDAAEGASVPVEVSLPFDLAAYEARGHRFEGSVGELARWVEGSDFGERAVVVVGEVSDPEYGAKGEPVAFSLESVVWREDLFIPPENQRVTGYTWDTVDTLDPSELGLYYPVVFGTPGKVSPGLISRGWITGGCSVWVERGAAEVLDFGPPTVLVGYKNLKIVLAGHPVKATRVYLSTDANPAGERFVVHQMQDNRGQIVSYVDATVNENDSPSIPDDWVMTDPDGNDSYGLGNEAIDASYRPEEYSSAPGTTPLFVGWFNDAQDAGGGEGGMVGPGGRVVRDAGDVLEVLLGFTGKIVDRGKFAAAKPLLSRFKIDTTVEVQIKPWQWAREELLPLLPVSIVTGPSGLYPVVWRLDATPADAVLHLDVAADPGLLRAGPIQVDSSGIRNEFSIDYAYSVRTANYYGAARMGAGPYDPEDPDTLVSLHCRLSQQRHRYSDGRPRIVEHKLETRVIYDTATAHAILAWHARAYALALRRISYVASVRDYGWLERGHVVLLSDPEISVERWLCLVENIELYADHTIGLQLLRIEDPARDGLRVS